jgi:glucosamine--fructose-6-phosphate aminotransferase (isomerizing)
MTSGDNLIRGDISMITDFEKEIFQQPEVIGNLVRSHSTQFEDLANQLRKNPPRFLIIAARGTSDNAAIYAKYLISGINKIPVGLAMPSLSTLYHQTPILHDGLVIGISQSGQTPDVLAVLEDAQQQGVRTVSITNVTDAPIADIADHNIVIKAQEEKSIAASKTFTAQLTAVAMLVAYLSDDNQLISDLDSLASYTEAALTQNPVTQAIAERFSKKDHIAIVGRGYSYCTVYEIALKIKETSYIVAQPYSAADFRHGPIALLEPGFPVLAMAVKGKALPDMEDMIASIKKKDADLAVMTNAKELEKFSEPAIRLPEEMPEWLSPIVGTVPGQLLALHLSLARGINPDKPRGLKKVTLTY